MLARNLRIFRTITTSCSSMKFSAASNNAAFRRIRALYDKYGESNYIGEDISITAHSLQSAVLAQKASNGDEELVLAALLHDMGHVLGMEAGQELAMDGCGILDHEGLGADFARSLGLSPRIEKLIRAHVDAKRYLCFKKPEYYATLTEASKTTLKFQGGVMSASEAKSFETDPDFSKMLLMRTFDEAAKEQGVVVPPLSSYESLLNKYSASRSASDYILSSAQLEFWRSNGYLRLANLLNFANFDVSKVSDWVNEVASWPKVDGKWLQHWELGGPDGKQKVICRTENFVSYHDGLSALCRGTILSVVSQLFREEAVLFKEKVNYKQPGGAGFAAHQDTPAYIGLAQDHISAMVTIDPATRANGCLEMAHGRWWLPKDVPLTADGVVTPEAESIMDYRLVECAAGEVVLFGGYTPHRSGPNLSDRSRRALFLTYNPRSQGDYHTEYYKAKHAGAKGFDGAHAISFQKDFQGTIVE